MTNEEQVEMIKWIIESNRLQNNIKTLNKKIKYYWKREKWQKVELWEAILKDQQETIEELNNKLNDLINK